MAIVAWKEKAERAMARAKALGEELKDQTVHIRHDGETIAAGAIAGAIRGSFEASGKDYSIPAPGGKKLPPELLIGGALVGLGVAAGRKPHSRDLHAAGAGVLAYSAGREAENYMRTKGAKAPGAVQ